MVRKLQMKLKGLQNTSARTKIFLKMDFLLDMIIKVVILIDFGLIRAKFRDLG